MKLVHMLAFALVIIGAVNWGLVGLADIDLVQAIFRNAPAMVQMTYVLVGLSGVYMLIMHKTDSRLRK